MTGSANKLLKLVLVAITIVTSCDAAVGVSNSQSSTDNAEASSRGTSASRLMRVEARSTSSGGDGDWWSSKPQQISEDELQEALHDAETNAEVLHSSVAELLEELSLDDDDKAEGSCTRRPHKWKNSTVLCQDGKYVYDWNCVAGGHGQRMRCPRDFPHLCAKRKCGKGGKDLCCARHGCKRGDFGGDFNGCEKDKHCVRAPHTGKDSTVLCEDGKYVNDWKCVAGGHGQRKQCPRDYPNLCAKETCGGGKDRCCDHLDCSKYGGFYNTCQEANLVKNFDFSSEGKGWTSKCPSEYYHDYKDVFGRCFNGSAWNEAARQSKHPGGYGSAWDIKPGRCWEGGTGGVFQDVSTEPGREYEFSYAAIDGFFQHNEKKAKPSKHYFEIQSPSPDNLILDRKVWVSGSSMDPPDGRWERIGPYKFTALGGLTRIYFYAGRTACPVIDNVVIRAGLDPKQSVRRVEKLIKTGDFKILSGFRLGGVHVHRNLNEVVVLKTSRKVRKNHVKVGLNTIPGGCSKLIGNIKVYGPGTKSGKEATGVKIWVDPEDGGKQSFPLTGSKPTVVHWELDPTSDSFGLWVDGFVGRELELHARLFLLCKAPPEDGTGPAYSQIQHKGSDGKQLCLSVALINEGTGNEAGCREKSCRQNFESDVSLQVCDETDWTQQFAYQSDSKLLQIAGDPKQRRCLSVEKSKGRCQPLSLRDCSSLDRNQHFSKRKTANGEIWVSDSDAGLVMDTDKGVENNFVRMCPSDSKSKSDSSAELQMDETMNSISETVALPSQPQVVKEKPTGYRDVVVKSGQQNPSVYAEAVCPWYFNPPIHTNSETLLRCYHRNKTCDLKLHGNDCCVKNGGTFQCPKSLPYMCKDTDGATNDYKCVASPELCSNYGGRRPCQGPPGWHGNPGQAGLAGPDAANGISGKAGAQGSAGQPGKPGTDGRNTKMAVSWFAKGASNPTMAFAFFFNLGVVTLTWLGLKRELERFQKPKEPPPDSSADFYADYDYAEGGAQETETQPEPK